MVQVFGVIREAERGCQMKVHRLMGILAGGEKFKHPLYVHCALSLCRYAFHVQAHSF